MLEALQPAVAQMPLGTNERNFYSRMNYEMHEMIHSGSHMKDLKQILETREDSSPKLWGPS